LLNNVEVKLDTAIYALPAFIMKPFKTVDHVYIGITDRRKSNKYFINFKGHFEAVSFLNPDSSFNYKIDKIVYRN